MGGVQGHYSNGRWHWETYGLFAIPGAIVDAVQESKRKKRYIEEQRRENERRRGSIKISFSFKRSML